MNVSKSQASHIIPKYLDLKNLKIVATGKYPERSKKASIPNLNPKPGESWYKNYHTEYVDAVDKDGDRVRFDLHRAGWPTPRVDAIAIYQAEDANRCTVSKLDSEEERKALSEALRTADASEGIALEKMDDVVVWALGVGLDGSQFQGKVVAHAPKCLPVFQ